MEAIAPLLACLGLLLAAPAAAQPLQWQGTTQIASGRGERGPWQQNESRYDHVDDPTAAVDDAGEIAVAWVDQARKDVFFQRLGPDGRPRQDPVNVSRSADTFSWLPRLALGPSNRVYLLWQEIIFSGGSHGGDILFARSSDGGRRFSPPINLSKSVSGDGKGRINREVWHNGSLDIAVGPGGVIHVAWTEYDGPLWFSRSTDGGETFSPPRHLAGEERLPARGPALAIAPDGSVYLAWTVGEDASADIRVARSTDGGGRFDAPQVVARSAGYSDAPKLAFDPGGVLHLVYGESSGGPFGRSRILYSRSADRGRSFESPRTISEPAPGAFASAAFPHLAVDGRGTLYVAWELYRADRQRPRGLGMAVSADGGDSITAPALVPDSIDPAGGSNGSHQGLLMRKLAVNRDGRVAIVNSSLKEGERSRVWLVRGVRSDS
jgi:hypothetical protein